MHKDYLGGETFSFDLACTPLPTSPLVDRYNSSTPQRANNISTPQRANNMSTPQRANNISTTQQAYSISTPPQESTLMNTPTTLSQNVEICQFKGILIRIT